jgi:hypothetical protein
MTHPTKVSPPTLWTREQARRFVSRASGTVALMAGVVALAALLFVNH